MSIEVDLTREYQELDRILLAHVYVHVYLVTGY